MDKYLANIISFLIIGLFLAVPASARVTVEAITANGTQVYNGATLSISPTINITIATDTNLTTESDAIVLRIDSTNNNLTPSSRNAGTITASNQQTLTTGTHNLRVMVKEITGTVSTFEVINLLVDSGGELKTQGGPLNFPNPCNINTGTSIGYKLTKPANITLSIHDLMGNLIWKNSYPSESNGGRATYNEVPWDCRTQSGQEVGDGIYVYLIVGNGKLLNKGKITVIK